MYEGSSRWRNARRAVLTPIVAVAVFAGGSVSAVLSAPGVSLATTPSTLSLGDAGTSVTTSNGMSWTLAVGWDQVISGETPTMSIILERTVTTGGTGYEIHDWNFQPTASTLKFNATTGVGTLNTGTQTNPVAKVDLAFKATSNKAATCTTGSEKVYSGTLKGKLTLVTGLTGGGTVGGTSLNFTVATPEITVDSGCVPPATNDCLATSAFISSTDLSTPIAGGLWGSFAGQSFASATVETQTTLTAPKGATRLDGAEVDAAAPKYNAKTKVFSVTTSTSGIVTGTATLSGGTVKKVKSTCSFGGKTYKLTETGDQNANYSSPAGKSISADTSLSGTMTVPNATGTGDYDIVTSKVS
jgi:hypothetical protein